MNKITKLLYLENTYLFDIDTKNNFKLKEDKFGKYIILNKTIFYPQGGGQPSDTGIIQIGDNIFKVNKVLLNQEGIVYHYGEIISGDFQDLNNKTLNIKLEINKESRLLNAKNHTAGHLIDIAVKNIGLNINATKGFHFNTGPYVEYSGIIEDINIGETRINLISKLNQKLENLIKLDLKIFIKVGEQDISNSESPEGKSYRFVYFEGYENLGCGCGGTHIKSTGELGKINIRKIKVSKGNTKISYEVI